MNIRFFNETDEDERNVYLNYNNEISDVDVVAVKWSHPVGSFRVKGNVIITHFIANFNARNYIYRITNYTAVNGGVLEYAYEVDYMKTYFYHKQFSGLNKALVTRSTNIADWSKYTPDNNRDLSGQYDVNNVVGNSITHTYFILIFGFPYLYISDAPFGTQAYLLDEEGFLTVQQELLESSDAEAIYSQIKKCYMVFSDSNNIGDFSHWNVTPVSSYTGIKYLKADGDWGEIEISSDHMRLLSHISNANLSMASGLSISVNDYQDLSPFSNYQIYAPYVGTIEMPAQMIPHDATTNISINYFWNVLDGTMKAQINDIVQTRTSAVSLPIVSMTTSNYTVQRTIADANYSNTAQNLNITRQINTINLTSSAIGGAVALTGSIATGNIAGAISSGLSLANTAADTYTTRLREDIATNNNETNYNNTLLQLATAGLTSGTSGGFEGLSIPSFILTKIRSNFITALANFSAIHGYIANKTAGNVSFTDGFKYWLNVDNIVVNRNENYALQDISRRYIGVNANEGIWWDYGSGAEHNPGHPIIDTKQGKITVNRTESTYEWQQNGSPQSTSVHNTIKANSGNTVTYQFKDYNSEIAYNAVVNVNGNICSYNFSFNNLPKVFYNLSNILNTLPYSLGHSINNSRYTSITYEPGYDRFGEEWPNNLLVDVDIRVPIIYKIYQDDNNDCIFGNFKGIETMQKPIIQGKLGNQTGYYTADLQSGAWQEDTNPNYIRFTGTYKFKADEVAPTYAGSIFIGAFLFFYDAANFTTDDTHTQVAYYCRSAISLDNQTPPTISCKFTPRVEPMQ